ncbi:MAG: aminopeptidase P family protein [Proteobacteria bacterium]|nr:MAG: aminopeptidase P family protein [Pseudomonadota bacterium]
MGKLVRSSVRQHGAMEYSNPPASLDAVREYRLKRVREQLARFDYAGILLFDQINVRYATDATNMQIWCGHYETRCAYVSTDGPLVLFDYGNYPHLVEGLSAIDEYRRMPSFYFFTAGSRGAEFAEVFASEIDDLLTTHGGGNRRLAVDRLSPLGSVPLAKRDIELCDGQEVMELARAIKSAAELQLMRASIDACEAGMRAMRDALAPGMTENALWSVLHQVNIERGGEWIETRLLSSGPRTNPWFRECSMRVMEAGDLVSFDTDLIGPYGYCADVSRTWVCGENRPTGEQRRLYACAHEQVQTNIERLKPGMTFEEVSRGAWSIPAEFERNRYGSLIHGVGLADEYPSIKHAHDLEARGYPGVVEPGMTLCVESYIGAENGREGVKLEEQVVVTDDGVERLSSYPYEEDWL